MKVNTSSLRGVLDRIIKVAERENVIYRILKDSNKTYLASILGYSRNGFSKKIKARSFSLSELVRIFKIIQNMSVDEEKKSRIDWKSVYIVRNDKENASVRRVRKTGGCKKQRAVPGVQEKGSPEENLQEKES